MSGPLISISKRLIKVQPVMTADDNADNDCAFDWTEIPNCFPSNGQASMLQSAIILDADFSEASIELIFCQGSDADGTAPTAAQGLIGGADTGSAAIDITAAEAQAVNICGSTLCTVGASNIGDLILANILTARDIGLILAPALNSTSIYVGGAWRSEPAATGATGTCDLYLGFQD